MWRIVRAYVCLLWVGTCSSLIQPEKYGSKCEEKADIVFMVDSSLSIRESNPPDNSHDNWDLTKDFVKQIIQQLPVESDEVRVGVIKFATRVEEDEIIYLNDYMRNPQELIHKVDALSYSAGNTNTSGAIRTMHDRLFYSGRGGRETGDRENVQNYGVLITDGMSNIDTDLTRVEARTARNERKIRMFTVGVTEYVNEGELEEIATDPISYHSFLSPNFTTLHLIVDQLLLHLCKAKPPPPTPCDDTRADLTFLVDSSGSIRKKNEGNESKNDNWLLLKQFVVEMIDNLNVRPDHTRISVIKFSYQAEVVFYLDTYTDAASMKTKILDMSYVDSTTNTSGALRTMRRDVFQAHRGDRPEVRNVGVIITDGEANVDENLTLSEARTVKRANIRMFAIGLTNHINERELTTIASDPVGDHYFNKTEISQVKSLVSKLVFSICHDVLPGACIDHCDIPADPGLSCRPDQRLTWRAYPGHLLVGHNHARVRDIDSAATCRRLCAQRQRCRSVDYIGVYRECHVSYVSKADDMLNFVEQPGAEYHELVCVAASSLPDGGRGDGWGGGGGGSDGGGGGGDGGGGGGAGGTGGGDDGTVNGKGKKKSAAGSATSHILVVLSATWCAFVL